MDECELAVLKQRSQRLARIEKTLGAFLRYVDRDFPLFQTTFDRHVKKLREEVTAK